jgi:2'-5' RNA ligase
VLAASQARRAERVRVFVALDIPGDVRAAVAALVAKLRPACGRARWARIEGAHVTLKFIGEVPAEKIGPIKAALARIRFPGPIEMKFRNVGFFPNERRPRVFWAGIEGGAELGALAAAVETSLEPIGIAREQRVFSPHLTLARFESPVGLDELHKAIAAVGSLEFGSTVAEEFHLYQSLLKPAGAEYTRLATFRFAGSESL